MTARRRVAELVAIVACFVAFREITGRLAEQLRIATGNWGGGLPFYAMWLVACVLAARAWGWPRWLPQRAAWRSPLNLLGLAAAMLTIEWLYGFKLSSAISGYLLFQWPAGFVYAVNAIIAAPVIEELVFRGLLWDAFRLRANAAVAFVMTSALFGIWHWASMLQPSWYGSGGSLLWAHMLFGAALGLVRWRFGAIVIGVIVHAVYNGLWVVVAYPQ